MSEPTTIQELSNRQLGIYIRHWENRMPLTEKEAQIASDTLKRLRDERERRRLTR